VLVAFDRPEPTFRHEADPNYKAQREAAPDILRQQMGLVRQVSAALNITVLDLAGWEADDIIATLAEQAKGQGHDVVIVTGDRDSYQLVHDPHVKVLYNKRGVSDYAFYDEAGIAERTGVTPAQYPQYAALRGDPSDNLPGVPGVGEKTAAKLLNHLRRPRRHLRPRRPSRPRSCSENLVEHEARARHNAELMVLRRDAPVEVDLSALTVDPDQAEVKRLFDFLEFRRCTIASYEALGAAGAAAAAATANEVLDAEITEAADRDAAVAFARLPATGSTIAAWSGEPGRSAGQGLAIVTDAAAADVAWLPAGDADSTGRAGGARPHRPGGAHHAKPLMRSLLGEGGTLGGLQLDTAIAAYLIDPAETRYAVARPAREATPDLQLARDGSGRRAGQLDFGGGDDGRVRAGAERSPSPPGRRARAGARRSRAWPSCTTHHREPARRGARQDGARRHRRRRRRAQQLNARLTAEVERSPHELQRIVGRPFNINSPIQLRDILYTERGLAPGKKTKTGYSTDAATLEKLRDQWPEFIDPLLRVPRGREAARHLRHGPARRGRRPTAASTRRSTRPWPAPAGCRATSRTCTTSRCAARRAACSGKAFVPAPGCELLVADYNQIELRCIAHLAEDPGLIEAFTSGRTSTTRPRSRVRRRVRRRHGRAAVEGEDGQLRPGLRHGGLRARAAARHPHRRGRGHPRRLLRGVPEREGLHGAHGRRGPHARLHRDAVRPPPPHPRAVELATSASARPASARR
jgi:DNA polymerase-1